MSAKRRCKLQEQQGWNFGAKLTHLCGFWLDVPFFSHVKKTSSRFLLDVSFFSRVETIVRSSDWLGVLSIVPKFPEISVGAKVKFPIGKELF